MRLAIVLSCLLPTLMLAAEPEKPRIAFFPLGGDAKEELREKVAFSLRSKLDRTGKYDVIDGPKMTDLAAEVGEAIAFATPPEKLKAAAKLADAGVIAWGELTNVAGGSELKLKFYNVATNEKPKELTKLIAAATDLRFVSEAVLEALPGVAKFEHPVEQAVWNDKTAEEMWAKQPNMIANGDFSAAGKWQAIYMAEKYAVEVSDKPPAIDKVNIHKLTEAGATNNVLAMNLSRTCAENNGMACLSERMEIAKDTRYRIAFRYKSDGPTLHVFVKGYVLEQNIKGEKVEREVYRRQVPPTGPTNGKWATVIDDLNPQHVTFPVQFLRVDLYAYLSPGTVMFDDVIVKPVGKQTRKATDEALDKPVERPKGAK